MYVIVVLFFLMNKAAKSEKANWSYDGEFGPAPQDWPAVCQVGRS